MKRVSRASYTVERSAGCTLEVLGVATVEGLRSIMEQMGDCQADKEMSLWTDQNGLVGYL